MNDVTSRSPSGFNRRAGLAGLGAGGLALALATMPRPAVAQDAATDLANHPLVGAWRVVPDPPGPPLVLIVYHADGTLVYSVPASAPAPRAPRPWWSTTPPPTGPGNAPASAARRYRRPS